LVIQIILTNKILRNRVAFEHQEVGSLIDFSNPPTLNFGRKTKLPPESAARKFLASVDFPYLIVDESHHATAFRSRSGNHISGQGQSSFLGIYLKIATANRIVTSSKQSVYLTL
jgi:hypothetical protein